MQRQCPWCSRTGPRYPDDHGGPMDGPHDGPEPQACVCRHITCASRRAALRDHGRYWDGAHWVCLGGCAGADDATLAAERETARAY